MKKVSLLFALLFVSCKLFSQSTNCSTATNLSLNGTSVCVNGTSAGAITDNILYGNCNASPVNVVWYTYVANGSNNQFTITPGTLTNAEIIIYQGGCPNTGTLQTCSTVTGSTPLTSTWGMTAGSQVWVGVASHGGVDGTFQLCIKSTPPPSGAGNTCASAVQICTTPFNQANVNYASGQSPACFGNAPQQDVFIKFTITQSGSLHWTATPNVANTEFDWALWDITNGCPGTLACCNYNYAAGSTSGFGMQAQAGTVTCGTSAAGSAANEFCGPMNVTCGKTYAIQISNYDNTGTGFTLNFTNSTALISSNAAFTISSPTVVCGTSLSATINNASTGGCNEVWNYGDGTPTYTGTAPPSHNYTTPGTYAITANIGGTCPSSATQFVQLLAPLAATAAASPVSCFGSCNGSATVNPVTGGDGIYTYLWSTGSTSTSINSLCAGVYSITVSNAKCNSSVTQTVNVTSPTQVSLTANPVIAACGGNNGSISLTGSGGTSPYTYNMNGGAFSTTTTYSNLAAGVYTMGVKDSKNCQAVINVTITTSTGPTVTVNSATTCAGTPVVITANGAATYNWSPSTGLSSASGTTVSANPAATTVYTVTGSTGGCTATAVSTVIINPLPAPLASNTGPYCAGNTIQLNTGAFTSYSWAGPSAFSSSSQSPSISSASVSNAGVYTVTVSDANGCVKSTTTSVTVNPLPNPIVGSNSPVCVNNSINLTASGGTAYSWSGPNGYSSAVQNPVIAGAGTVQSGVYTVTVTASGCTNTGTVNVSVLTPTTSASNTGPFCAGTTIQLNNPGATSYTWTGPSGFTSNAQNPAQPAATTAMSGNYTVIVSIGSCTATATTSVLVNPLPAPSASNTGPYCAGNTVQLNTGAFTTYTWTGPSAFSSSSQSPSVPSASVSNAGIYTVTVSDANGCVKSTTTSVTVNPLPNPVVGSNNPVCVNNSINLTATGGTGYSWSGPNGFTSAVQNPVIANAGTVQSGVYDVTVTALGCVNTGSVSVSVLNPTTTASNNGPYCAGTTIQLNTPAASSYTWSGPSAFSSNAQNATQSLATTAMSGNYTVIVTIGSCTAMATTQVTVNALPAPLANNNGPVCIGQSVFLTSNGGNSYSWNGPAGFTSAVQNPSIAVSALNSAGNYTVTVTDVNNCVNSTVTAVTVNNQPVVSATGTTVCENANAQLSASGGTSYNWSGPGGFTSAQQNPVLSNAVPSASGQYMVLVTDANTCTNTAVATVVIMPSIVPGISSNNPVCLNSVMDLFATGGTSYAWTGPNGFMSGVQNPTVIASSVGMSGTYYVTVNVAGGCSGTASVNVLVNSLPTLSLSSGPNAGCAPLCVNYSVSSVPSASVVGWNFGNGLAGVSGLSASSCYTATGIYTITSNVTDVNGCISSVTYTAQVYPKPTADFVTSPVKPIENIDMVHFTDISYGTPISGWNWYMLAGSQYTSNLQNPDFLYQEAGIYPVVLVVKSDHGCLDTLLKTVQVVEDFGIWVPNAFTPNGDGVNDYFSAKGFGIVKFRMQIWDRWGESIFVSDDILNPWYGNYQGRGDKICQDDVYVWKINVVGVNGKTKELVGHVTLLK